MAMGVFSIFDCIFQPPALGDLNIAFGVLTGSLVVEGATFIYAIKAIRLLCCHLFLQIITVYRPFMCFRVDADKKSKKQG